MPTLSNKTLCLGPLWHGSNANALFKAFRRCGLEVSVVDEFHFIALHSNHFIFKLISRLFRFVFISTYNQGILKVAAVNKPDFVLVYKGAFVKPSTLLKLKQHCPVYCFYPDVSLFTHGKYISKSIPHYDKVFTTKTFGIEDLKNKFDFTSSHFIPHGFDPDVHRKLDVENTSTTSYACDVSFIGTWSPKKEKIMAYVISSLPEVNIKIWGSQWSRATTIPSASIMHATVNGDEYALAIQSSKINLGLLSEKRIGSSSGDQITSRTFHIPACGGFLIHEQSTELEDCFEVGSEVVNFTGEQDLVDKIKHYLDHNAHRDRIAASGYKRVRESHSIDHRAQNILTIIHEKSLHTV